MIKTIPLTEAVAWNQLIKTFDQWDIYYTNEYARSLQIHGDGEPFLLHWTSGNKSVCYILIKEDIANDKNFQSIISPKQYFDASTPYGYGGPLTNEELSIDDQKQMIDEINKFAYENGIISQFIRFHPLLNNQTNFNNVIENYSFKETVYIQTNSEEQIWSDMESNNRNMIRKAIKSGVTIEFDHGEHLNDFIQIYNSTMDNHTADEYYYFDNSYYQFLISEMRENILFGYAVLDGKIICSSIFFYNDRFMHYHLSGTLSEYRKYASTNLLLYEASKWAASRGIQKFHLGGGLNANDSLFKFKKKFNKHGIVPFYIGRIISDQEKYNELLRLRAEADPSFDIHNQFLIQYRR